MDKSDRMSFWLAILVGAFACIIGAVGVHLSSIWTQPWLEEGQVVIRALVICAAGLGGIVVGGIVGIVALVIVLQFI